MQAFIQICLVEFQARFKIGNYNNGSVTVILKNVPKVSEIHFHKTGSLILITIFTFYEVYLRYVTLYCMVSSLFSLVYILHNLSYDTNELIFYSHVTCKKENVGEYDQEISQ